MSEIYDLSKIIGLEVKTIRGYRANIDKKVKKPYIEPVYILFNDYQTLIQLEEQDYYTYHDCSSSAKIIRLFSDKDLWTTIFTGIDGHYPEANTSL